MAISKRFWRNKKMNIGDLAMVMNMNIMMMTMMVMNVMVMTVIVMNMMVMTVIVMNMMVMTVLVMNLMVMTMMVMTRLDARDSWMEAMATLTDSEDDDAAGISSLPTFKRKTGEDAVSLLQTSF